MPDTMARPFISYAREDQAAAVRLANELRSHGIDPWLDIDKLLPGQNWQHEIREALHESTHFIALLSRSSVNKRGYVQKELKRAFDLLEEFPPGQIFLIPVRLEPVKVSYVQLSEIHRVDLFPDHALAVSKILAALQAPRTRTRQRKRTSTRVGVARHVSLRYASRAAAWGTRIGVNDLMPDYSTLAQELERANIKSTYLFSSHGVSQPPPKYHVIVAGPSASMSMIRQACQAAINTGQEWYLQLWNDNIGDTTLAIGSYGYGGSPAIHLTQSFIRKLLSPSFTRSKLQDSDNSAWYGT